MAKGTEGYSLRVGAWESERLVRLNSEKGLSNTWSGAHVTLFLRLLSLCLHNAR